jgi:hypothetical protein
MPRRRIETALQGAALMKPVFYARDIKEGLKAKYGAFLKRALDGVVSWQFDDPEGGLGVRASKMDDLGIPGGSAGSSVDE